MDLKRRILIVDDEPINLEFFDVMLGKLGFEVDKAEDGEEALEKIKANPPDLVLLDNIMPRLSGWEVTRILKNDDDFADFKNIPIIMFSAMDNVKDKIEGFELGIEDYITKPFNFSEVLARIKSVLHNKELSKKILVKEKKIAIIESLNKSLIYFTEHLKPSVTELLNQANKLKSPGEKPVTDFISLVKKECKQVLAALDGLNEEIQELKGEREKVSKESAILEELDKKFQKHFEGWKKKHQQDLEGVSK